MPSPSVLACSALLASHNLSVSMAESATSGRMAAEFSLCPDSGTVLKGGIVCYDACLKEDILNVDPLIIERYSPESAEVTRELCMGLRKLIRSDLYLAVTGLSTSGGSEDAQKPVGTMFMHILYGSKSRAIREVFKGSAEEIILSAIDRVCEEIMDLLRSKEVNTGL